MDINKIKEMAFSMPLMSPAYPKIAYSFKNREYLIISYETDLDALQARVPEPLKVINPIVKFEFIKMPDSYGFGDYTEAGQIIPVEYQGKSGSYVLNMFLDDFAPIAAGREIWGFPKKYAHPELTIAKDTLLGVLRYKNVEIANATMGYKYQKLDNSTIKFNLENEANYLLKIIPHANGSDLSICQLIRYYLTKVTVKEAFAGPAALNLFHHALAPIAALPVKKIIGGTHIIADLELGFGEVMHDYLI